MILTSIDNNHDAMYVRLQPRRYDYSSDAADGIIVDFDKNGRILGIEILDASERLSSRTLNGLQFMAPSFHE